jgi:pimeloyl-ACP methyl ester carboxylesterase
MRRIWIFSERCQIKYFFYSKKLKIRIQIVIKVLSPILACFIACISCATYYRTPIPLRAVYHQDKRLPGHDTLIVFLPGYLSVPEDFEKENFVDSLKRVYPKSDSVAIDAGIGYYMKKMLPERLIEDVIKPARKAGYARIWLVGISMGGSGALWYLTKYPDTINGVLLLSPFLGDEKLIKEIETSGGLQLWEPKTPLDADDYQRAQWLWLKHHLDPGKTLPFVALGFGEHDRFYRENMLLARCLPPNQVFFIKGGHRWETWAALFTEFLSSGMLQK